LYQSSTESKPTKEKKETFRTELSTNRLWVLEATHGRAQATQAPSLKDNKSITVADRKTKTKAFCTGSITKVKLILC